MLRVRSNQVRERNREGVKLIKVHYVQRGKNHGEIPLNNEYALKKRRTGM
jgi:hypothetical protein